MEAPNTHIRAMSTPGEADKLGNWLPQLLVLMPPESVLHVGAGDGADLPDYALWGLKRLLLVEADEQKAASLQKLASLHTGWQVQHALVAEAAGDAMFHVASNTRESGLLSAEAQRPLWRNMQSRSMYPMQAVRMDQLWAADSTASPNWIVVDCLPAAALLRGAADLVAGCDVLLARVATLSPQTLIQAPGSTLTELVELLESHGLQKIGVVEERMPLVARALFVRRPGAGSRALNAALEEASISKEHAKAVQVACDQELSELRQRHALLEADKQAVSASRDELQMGNEALRMGHARLESEIQNLLVSQAKSESDRERLSSLHAELQEQLVATRQTCAVVEAEAEAMRSALADRDALVKDLAAARSELASVKLTQSTDAEATSKDQANLRATLAELEERLTDAQGRLCVLESERSRLIVSGASAAAKLDELQAELDVMSRQKARMEVLAAERLTENAGLHVDLQGRNDQLENLASEGEGLRQSLVELQACMASVEGEKSAQETELALTRNHVQYIEGLLSEANGKLHAQLVRAAEQDGAAARLGQQVADHAAELQDCKRQIADAERARHQFDIEIAKAAAQIALIGEVLVKHAAPTNPDRT